jgi:protein TonB
MDAEEKSYSACLDVSSIRRGVGISHISEGHVGIACSLLVHIVFVFLLMIQPGAKMIELKTFHISFDAGASFLQGRPIHPDAGVKGTGEKPSLVHNPIKKHNPPVRPKQANRRTTVERPAAARLAPIDQITPEDVIPPVEEKYASVTTTETHLPPVIGEPKGDEFIDARAVPASGTAGALAAPHEKGIHSVGIFDAGGGASEGAFGDGSGGYASTGTGSGDPLETRFGEMNAPRFIHREIPVYPASARRRGKEGRVVLTLLIDSTGSVQKIDVTESPGYGLTEAAIEAVRKSTFAPARIKGRNIASRAVLPIRFKLE